MTSGVTPTPQTTRPAGSSRPPAVTTRSTRSSPSNRATSSAWTIADAALREHAADVRADRARPRVRSSGSSSSITIVTCLPSSRERRGDLAADVGPADADDVLGLVELAADRVGVAVRADVVDAVELGAVDLQAPHHRAGRHERVLVADRLLRRERRLARLRVELHDARARQQLDRRAVEPAGLGVVRGLASLLAPQVLLRQRRAVVRRVELAAREQHAALESGARRARARRPRRRRRRR